MKSKNRETFKWNEITSTMLKFKIFSWETLHPPRTIENFPIEYNQYDISTTLSLESKKRDTPERDILTIAIANVSPRNPRWTKLLSGLERGPFSGGFSRRDRDTQNTQRHEKKKKEKEKTKREK